MEFHDYIIDYPLQDDKNIQLKTTLREEFYDLRGASTEEIPKQGEFFKHQDLFTRYLRQYDRILNIHETGTGKTGSIIDAAETFKKDFIGIKQVIVIEPGKPTLDDFKSQIVKFFPEEYDDTSSNSEFIRKRNITKKVDKWYLLDTYETFSNRLSKMSLEEIKQEYSDSMFFLDEAHRMRNYGDSDKEDVNIYTNMWKLLHITERTKIVIGTATPLVNSVNDFVPLMNLLLPSNFQLPQKNWDYSNITLTQLEPFFRGKISFVRSLDTGVVVNYSGKKILYTHEYNKPIDGQNLKIPPVIKIINEEDDIVETNSSIQPKNRIANEQFKSDMNITLLSTKKTNGEKTLQNISYIISKTKKQSFELASRESSVFVFPDGSWGSEGFDKYIKQVDGSYKFNNEEIKDYLTINNKLSLPKLFELSSKFWYYINKELEAAETGKPGNSFCYIEFVKGSGAILLGLLLELFGFENFTRKTSVFYRDKGVRKLQKTFKKKKRFSLITSKSENIENILQLFNSKENIDGEYLQIVIASKVARDGINLANVLRGYIMSPGWHESGMYQALSRFIRATSHKMLLDRKQDVEINIYKLATCLDTEIFNGTVDLDDIKSSSIDVFNYIKSEEKDLVNRNILRDMKNVAFDAILNYQRNHRLTDTDNTKQTDYGSRFPRVWSRRIKINKGEIITNTKKLIYYKKNIEKLNKLIKDRLFNFKLITMGEIISFAQSQNIEDFYIYLYIKRELENLIIYDNIGNKRKIIREGSVFYLDKVFYHYTSNSLNTLPIIEDTEVQEVSRFYDETNNMNIDNLENYIREKLWRLDTRNKPILAEMVPNQEYMIRVLEDCIINIRNGSTDPIKKMIYELFIHYINKANYPHNDVEKVNEAYSSVSTKAGRAAKKYSSTKLTGLNFLKLDNGNDTVYYHFFNIVTETTNIPNIFRREDNNVRILRSNSDSFEDANINELPIFQSYYKEDIGGWILRYQRTLNNGIQSYGTVLRDNKFRIINPPFGSNKGTVCGTSKDITMDILTKINLNTENLEILRRIMPKHISIIERTMTEEKEEMEKFLYPETFENINQTRDKYFWERILMNSKSKELCDYLKEYFKITDKLLYTF